MTQADSFSPVVILKSILNAAKVRDIRLVIAMSDSDIARVTIEVISGGKLDIYWHRSPMERREINKIKDEMKSLLQVLCPAAK